MSTPPPYILWPPLPAASPTAAATADVYFTAPRQKRLKVCDSDASTDPDLVDGDLPLGVQIRWIGDASHCIEVGRELQVRIIPIAIFECGVSEGSTATWSDRQPDSHDSGNTTPHNMSQSNHNMSQFNHNMSQSNHSSPPLPSLLPTPVGGSPTWTPEAVRLHRRLQTGQWRLVDRAIHLILQAQVGSNCCLIQFISN